MILRDRKYEILDNYEIPLVRRLSTGISFEHLARLPALAI